MNITQGEKKMIQEYYGHGIGQRYVRITSDGRVLYRDGSVEGADTVLHFGGFVDDVLARARAEIENGF